jgi:hypothetical protein
MILNLKAELNNNSIRYLKVRLLNLFRQPALLQLTRTSASRNHLITSVGSAKRMVSSLMAAKVVFLTLSQIHKALTKLQISSMPGAVIK